MTMNDVPEPENLMPPEVCKDDFLKAMTRIRPTVSVNDLLEQEKFTEEFGSEGS